MLKFKTQEEKDAAIAVHVEKSLDEPGYEKHLAELKDAEVEE